MWLVTVALASPDAVIARMDEVEALRKTRLARHAPAIPHDVYARVAEGEVVTGSEEVEGSATRKVWGVGIVDVGIGPLFSAINDDRQKVDYTKLSHVIVVAGEPCGTDRVVFQVMDVPFPLTDRWWTIRQQINTGLQTTSGGRVREMIWTPADDPEKHLTDETRAISDGKVFIDHTYGGWFLVDLGEGRTLVEFWTWAHPGGNVPVRLVTSFAANGIDETLDTMSALARKGPSCSL